MLSVHGNTFRCQDRNFVHLANFARSKAIFYDDPCKRKGRKNGHKFEKMMIDPSITIPPKPNGWLYDQDEDAKVEIKVVEKCSKHIYDMDSSAIYDRYIMEVISLSPILYTMFTLIFGVTLGKIYSYNFHIYQHTSLIMTIIFAN